MKLQICPSLLIQASRSRSSIHRIMPLIMLILFVAACRITYGKSIPEPECEWDTDGYALMKSSFESAEVSDRYARAIFQDVQRIIYGFLGDDCFFNPYIVDSAGRSLDDPYYTGVKPNLLDLSCEVGHESNNVLLSIQINSYNTQETLLTFETTAPFFQPTTAVAAFAATFPMEFAGQVVRQYSYTFPPQEFWGSWGGGLFLGNRYYPPADLKQDLTRMEGVPPEVIQSLRRYRTKNTISVVVFVAGTVTWIAAMVTGSSMENRDVLDKEVNTKLIVVCCAGGLVSIAATLPLLRPPPRKLITTLNDWCCAE